MAGEQRSRDGEKSAPNMLPMVLTLLERKWAPCFLLRTRRYINTCCPRILRSRIDPMNIIQPNRKHYRWLSQESTEFPCFQWFSFIITPLVVHDFPLVVSNIFSPQYLQMIGCLTSIFFIWEFSSADLLELVVGDQLQLAFWHVEFWRTWIRSVCCGAGEK